VQNRDKSAWEGQMQAPKMFQSYSIDEKSNLSLSEYVYMYFLLFALGRHASCLVSTKSPIKDQMASMVHGIVTLIPIGQQLGPIKSQMTYTAGDHSNYILHTS
jgi:hypothetical protein